MAILLGEGLEPSIPCGPRILSPVRIPVPPPRLVAVGITSASSGAGTLRYTYRSSFPKTRARPPTADCAPDFWDPLKSMEVWTGVAPVYAVLQTAP